MTRHPRLGDVVMWQGLLWEVIGRSFCHRAACSVLLDLRCATAAREIKKGIPADSVGCQIPAGAEAEKNPPPVPPTPTRISPNRPPDPLRRGPNCLTSPDVIEMIRTGTRAGVERRLRLHRRGMRLVDDHRPCDSEDPEPPRAA